MKNIIRINLDVNERNESNIGIPLPQKVIRSKDTAVIIEMRIIGYDVNDGYTFTLLSEYTKSKRHTLYTIGDRLKIEGNVVTFVPPAELISTLEIVTNTLYIEKSGVSLDFSKFHYLAQLSEVDNTVGSVKEVYDDNYQALIDELEFKYMLIEDLTAEYVAAQVAEARVGADGTIYRFLKERLDVEHQKVTAQVGEVSDRLELTNNEIIDARGGKPTLRVRLNEIDRVDEYGKHWTLIDGEWEERVGQTQLINVRGEVAWAMAEAEQAREDVIKAYEDAVAEAKRSADIEDALIRTKIEQGLSAVETELTEAKQEAQNAYTNAVAEAEAKVQAKDEEYQIIFGEYDSTIETIEEDSNTAKTKAEQALAEAGISTDLAQTAKDLATTAQTNASTAISNASKAQIDASAAVSDASQAKADASQAQADAQIAITEAGEAVDSANTAKTNAQTALEDAQTALSTAENADTKSGLAEAAANTAKTNAQTALDNSNTAITNAADAITKAGQAEDTANTAKTNAQTAIDNAQSALTEAGSAKTTADTLSIKVDDLEGEVELKASQTEVDGISGTVSTHTTTIGQHATAIASKAEKSFVDTLSGTVSDQGTLITQNATDIKSKASQTEVDTVKGTVDDHATEISQNATDIASKASSTSVNTLTGRVNTAETTITQHTTSIASKASQTEVDTVKGTVSGHTTTLSQHATAISSKAESELVDTIKGTVDTHTTEISQNATDIASKASSASVNTLTGRVDTHTTEISQNATDIASKANTATVNTLTGRVDTAESNISQNATAITQRVTTTTYNTGIANKENTVLKQTTAPTHVNGRLWLDTSVTPNILKRSNGTTWIKATPTTPGEVGAYSQAAGAGLAGRLTTAETNITQTATAITSKADKSTVDTLSGTVSTQGTTITQQADLIASKASQTEVDTVKGTVAGHTTTISQHANQIASKAETNLVNAIKGTVDNHTTEISQNATDIASKASSSSVNTLTGRVSTAETTISQHATEITSKASQEEVDTVKGTVSGHTTTLSQHADQIASKAESSLVNAIKGTVDTHTTEISQNATDIASKASSSSVNTLTGRVSTAETEIGQNATAITSKASQSEVDTVKGTVSNHTTQISQNAQAIAARLTSTQVDSLVDNKGLAKVSYVDNQISATADGFGVELTRVEGVIDGIEIGGRNLIRESELLAGKYIDEVTGEVGDSIPPVHITTGFISVNSGQTYTLQNVKEISQFRIVYYNSSKILLSGVNLGSRQKTFQFDIPGSVSFIRFSYRYSDSTEYVQKTAKLEKGNKATDWTPAPEDMVSSGEFDTFYQNEYSVTAGEVSRKLSSVTNVADKSDIPTDYVSTVNINQTVETALGTSQTISRVEGKVDGLQVGGTNLVIDSKREDGWISDGSLRTPDHTQPTRTDFIEVSNANDYATKIYPVYNNNDLGHSAGYSFYNSSKVYIGELRFRESEYILIKSQIPANTRYMRFWSRYTKNGGIKIEKGNKITDWSPAPEDMVSQTDTAYQEVIATADRFTRTIGSTDSDVKSNIAQIAMTDSLFQTTVRDSIEIGGRNYYSPSKVNNTGVIGSVGSGSVGVNSVAKSFYVSVKKDEVWSLSRTEIGNANRFSYTFSVDEPLVGVQVSGGIDLRNDLKAEGIKIPYDGWLYIYLANNVSNAESLQNIKLEKGNKATDWTPSPEDKADQSQVTQLSDSWALTLKSGNDIKTQINASTNSIRLASKFIHLSGTSLIDNTVIKSAHIDSLNANKITGNTADFNTIRAGVLTTDAVTATHIKSDTALIDNIFATQALVDRLWAKAIWTNKITAMEIDAGKITSGTINAARLNVTDLRSKILTANVIDATQINASAAVFNKLFSTVSATNRLVAQGAWITNANIVSINASKINAGTISADRISTSSLDNVEIGGRNYFSLTHLNSLSPSSWVSTSYLYQFELEPNTEYILSSNLPVGQNSLYFNGSGSEDRMVDKNQSLTRTTDSEGKFLIAVVVGRSNTNDILNGTYWVKLEKGNKATDWTPAPEDIVNDLGSSGKVEIHGGNIKADTLDVGAITGNLGEFINLSLKAQNSQASLSGASFRIESIANNQSYIEMSNAPEIRARSADSSMAVMGQGRTSYRYDGSERFYFGSKLNGWQNGMMIRKHHGWGIMRESDSSNGVPAKYYTVKAGQQRVAVIEALMRDPTVTEVPTGNETQFIINSNYLGRLNGYTNSTSSTIAYPWPTLRTGDLIKYAEEIPGNESGVQQVFDIWDDNHNTVSAFGVHVTFHGGYSGASDRNIKHDIKDSSVEALEHIKSLTFKEFRYNQDNRYEPIGMIAQDSGILRVKSAKVESIDIQRSIMLSLKGVQELHEIIKEQAEEIKQLKEIINQ